MFLPIQPLILGMHFKLIQLYSSSKVVSLRTLQHFFSDAALTRLLSLCSYSSAVWFCLNGCISTKAIQRELIYIWGTLCKYAVICPLKLASHKTSFRGFSFLAVAFSFHNWEHMSDVNIRICSCSSAHAGGKALLNYLQCDADGRVVIESDKPHIIQAYTFFSLACMPVRHSMIRWCFADSRWTYVCTEQLHYNTLLNMFRWLHLHWNVYYCFFQMCVFLAITQECQHFQIQYCIFLWHIVILFSNIILKNYPGYLGFVGWLKQRQLT